MKRLLIVSLCFVFLVGCFPRNMKDDLSNALQPATLRYSFNTQPPNLKEQNKCNTAEVSIIIINAEKRSTDVSIARGWYINSQTITGMMVDYLKDAYRQCRILHNQESGKVIALSFQKIEGYIRFNSGATLQINVTIPEKNITIPFVITQTTMDLHNAVAYAIHDVSWQIINDPTIQDYILCR